jgi:hypothetical protein
MKIKSLLILLVCVLAIACTPPPKKATAEFLKGTWTSAKYKVDYGFIGKSTMFISDDVEGEEYHYIIKNDSIIFQMIIDEMIGVTEFDTMTYRILGYDSIEINYQGFHTTLIRNKP